MFKGTNASAGIGIGKAAIIKEVEMVIRPDKVASVETEVQRFRGALANTVAQTKALADDLATKVGEKEAEMQRVCHRNNLFHLRGCVCGYGRRADAAESYGHEGY